MLFDAYSQFEESMLTAKLEAYGEAELSDTIKVIKRKLAPECGIKPEQEAVDFSKQNLCVNDAGDADAKLLAFDLSKNQTLKALK